MNCVASGGCGMSVGIFSRHCCPRGFVCSFCFWDDCQKKGCFPISSIQKLFFDFFLSFFSLPCTVPCSVCKPNDSDLSVFEKDKLRSGVDVHRGVCI